MKPSGSGFAMIHLERMDRLKPTALLKEEALLPLFLSES